MTRAIILLSSVCVFAACGPKHVECRNTNPVFSEYSPDDKPYKLELLRQLKSRDKSQVHYYIDKYVERNKKPFMTITIEADGLCAHSIIDIRNENKMVHFKNVRGLSYTGAELVGLQFGVDSIPGNYVFIFEEVKEIKK